MLDMADVGAHLERRIHDDRIEQAKPVHIARQEICLDESASLIASGGTVELAATFRGDVDQGTFRLVITYLRHPL